MVMTKRSSKLSWKEMADEEQTWNGVPNYPQTSCQYWSEDHEQMCVRKLINA
jgi:hypothetical protein